ncbi:hypothetical protein [Microbacter margulisiae]|uniref:Lipocalin-like domain-containing protein n=1 Tax=Microbacter margulisiae TaxID=1350067 RepID=A0A7W5DRJ6_9PORP|nr:hypothetical protein [Microbacter margulisiae]MBB3187440.1 hypothetical protein [Microbacter margulisiae]
MKKMILIMTAMMSFVCLAQCNNADDEPVNMVLYDQPASSIQQYIQGNWKYVYSLGGLLANNKTYPADNSYMRINSNRIVFTNEAQGTIVDTTIVWKYEPTIYGYSTSTLGYTSAKGGFFPSGCIVEHIKNDTLVIVENWYDPVGYYFSKMKS